MKGIAAKVIGGQRRLCWLDSGFHMKSSSPVRGFGFNLNFGGIFTSVPAMVFSMARRDAVILEPAGAHPASDLGSHSGPRRRTEILLVPRTDIFGLGLDYAMYHRVLWGNYDQDDNSPWLNLGG